MEGDADDGEMGGAMAQQLRSDPRGMVTTLGRAWGWVLFFGIVTLVAGLMTVAWPDQTILVVAILVGIQLFVSGIFRLVASFTEEGEGHRAWWVILGLLSIAVGILCLRNLFVTIAALTLVLGIVWVLQGITEFFAGVMGSTPNRGWTIFMGIVGFIAGIVVLVYPFTSILAVAWVFGVWLIFYGIMEIVLAFRIKALGGAAATAA
jgi:uncharacterized membrane protein HdeD (DUF308 family)